MKKTCTLLLLVVLALTSLRAQVIPIADSLNAPIGVTADPYGNAWVAEVGSGNNDGSISYVSKSGTKHKVMTGLPSKLNPVANDIVGPWRVIPMTYGRMAVLIGGNHALGASFGRLLFYDLSGFIPGTSAPKTLSDTTHSFDIATFGRATSTNDDSDPFSAVQDEDGHWYITDAGANTIIRISRNGKHYSVLARFSGFPNPTPVGPPFVDAVPTGIVALPQYGGFLVTTLTGFPFLQGKAGVYKVGMDGTITPYATGLTLLTDIALDRHGVVYVNQFGKFGMAGFVFGSGQVIRIRNGHVIDTIAKGFGPGSGLSVSDSRKIFVTSLFTNQLLVGGIPPEAAATAALESRERIQPGVFTMSLYPNPTTDKINVNWNLADQTTKAALKIYDVTGKTIWIQNNLPSQGNINNLDVKSFIPGAYILALESKSGISTQKFSIIR